MPPAPFVAGPGRWSWPVRVVIWSVILALPCWWCSGAYERWLATAIKALMALTGHALRIDRLEVFAPLDIGIFASMCLASRNAPGRLRARAIAIGLPLLVAMEVVVLLGATFVILSHQRGALEADLFRDLPGNMVKTIGWVNALVLWLALLGRWELPSPGRGPSPGLSPKSTRVKAAVAGTMPRGR